MRSEFLGFFVFEYAAQIASFMITGNFKKIRRQLNQDLKRFLNYPNRPLLLVPNFIVEYPKKNSTLFATETDDDFF